MFSQGDPANAVFYIQKGKVKVTVPRPGFETTGWAYSGGQL